MNLSRPTLLLASLLAFLLIVSRAPIMPGQLFSEDEVNFAYAIGHLDTRISQPQPPGYPVFVLETRILEALRFKRPENNLQALAYVASAAAIALAVAVGNSMFGSPAGWWAAMLLLFYPAFWYAGITSAVRVHLAVVSLAVAGSCWRLLASGGRRWLYLSTLALGAGSGIRPELGPLLLPLWLWCVFRGERTWRHRWFAGGLLAACVFAWFLWVALSSGGVVTYLKGTWLYFTDQVAAAPTLAGEKAGEGTAALAKVLVWVGTLVPGLLLPAMLAWRRSEGLGLSGRQVVFLALWALPLLVFAGWVHLADPGHALAIVPAICAIGGGLIDRASRSWGSRSGWREPAAVVALAGGIAYAMLGSEARDLAAIPAVGLLAGLLLPKGERLEQDAARAWHLGLVLLIPCLCLSTAFFLQRGRWKVPQPPAGLLAQINLQAVEGNLSTIERVIGPDHRAIVQAREWIAERPTGAAVLWHESNAHWRKVAYYLPLVPVAVVLRTAPPSDPRWVVEIARSGETELQTKDAETPIVPVRAGSRLVWMVNPGGTLVNDLRREGLTCTEEAVCRMDVPEGDGARRIGQIEIVW